VTRYLAVVGILLTLLLGSFVLAEALHVPLLTDPAHHLTTIQTPAAVVAVSLLVSDVVLPVPSSAVMLALGALYGPVIGALLAVLGRVLMAATGYAIGQRGGRLLSRLVPPDGYAAAEHVLRRWGTIGIVITRPVPLLAETTVIMAGASSIGLHRVLVAAFIGSTPEAILYTLSGALARSVDDAALIWTALLIVAGGFWFVGRRTERRLMTRDAR
jgi:uncharacterized membrane protein YdjX (TVP38/TMEM64 family)